MTTQKVKPGWLRQFCTKVATLGFTFDGYCGSGHPRFRHDDLDLVVTAPLTPSDWRSERNTLAYMERVTGRKLPRANAGHYRHQPKRHLTLVRDDDDERFGDNVAELLELCHILRTEWERVIALAPSHATAATARKVIADYDEIRDRLAQLHQPIPPLTEMEQTP